MLLETNRRTGRKLNRLRFLLDRKVTPATVLDWMCDSHPDSAILTPAERLPYPVFPNPRISPGEALAFVARTGEVLKETGMRRRDRVAIFKRNEVDYVLLSLAVIRAGGIAVPINPGMPFEALDGYLRYTGSRILCCDEQTFAATIGEADRLPMIERWVFTDRLPGEIDGATVLSEAIAEVDGSTPPVSLHDDEHVILAHTSGTTGVPKAVIGTSRSVKEGIRAHYRTEPPLPWNRVAIAGPFSHLVYQIGLTTLLLSNMPCWAIARDDPELALATIERERINLFVAFPRLYLEMYARGLDRFDLDSMRVWIAVADTSQELHMRAFCEQGSLLKLFGRSFGSVFIEPLGSSEIGGPALRRVRFAGSRIRFERRIGRRMLGGPKAKVADADGRSVSSGKVGRLMVKGPTLFAGYWNSHDRLHGTIADGWWATGDVVRRDRLRRFYHLDRETDVIHTAYGPFYTLTAEDVLHTYPGVYEAVVFGISAQNGDQAPVALVWADKAIRIDQVALLHWANDRIDGPARLQSVWNVLSEDIPRGLTGKVLKRVLRERYGESTQAISTGVGNDR